MQNIVLKEGSRMVKQAKAPNPNAQRHASVPGGRIFRKPNEVLSVRVSDKQYCYLVYAMEEQKSSISEVLRRLIDKAIKEDIFYDPNTYDYDLRK